MTSMDYENIDEYDDDDDDFKENNKNSSRSSSIITKPKKNDNNNNDLDDGRPWVERYRPKTLEQVSHQSQVVSTLQNAVRTGRLPHLLFYGPPGSGKTSVALALCRQLYGNTPTTNNNHHPNNYKRHVLELNASDERGISVVRDKIKQFASLAVGENNHNNKLSNNNINNTNKNVTFKIIILDEADTVTPDAQAALRRIIEAYSKITRFILICNYVTRIIEPLASRCAKFRFQPLPSQAMRDRLMEILRENSGTTAAADDETTITTPVDFPLEAILETCQGDLRRAVMTLQSVQAVNRHKSTQWTAEEIADLAGIPPPWIVEQLWQSFQQTQFDVMQTTVQNVLAEGYAAPTLLKALLPCILQSPSFHNMALVQVMAQAEFALAQGADEYLQLLQVGSAAVQSVSLEK